MSEISWIKLKTDMFNDNKIQLIQSLPDGDALLVIWIRLITLAGTCNQNGFILIAEDVPYTPDMLATIFNKPLTTIQFALQTFEKFKMIENTSKGILLVNFDKHQNVDGLERAKEKHRIRQQKYKAKQKQLLLESSKKEDSSYDDYVVTSPLTSPVTQDDASRIRNKNKEIDINNISNDIANLDKPNSDTAPSQKIDYELIKNYFNEICTELPAIRSVTEQRKKKIKTLINYLNKNKLLDNHELYDKFKQLFNLVKQSDFLSGRTNNSNSWCCFDWIINTTNATKIIEGNYSQQENKTSQSSNHNKSNNKFNNFTQRQYSEKDLNELERACLNR